MSDPIFLQEWNKQGKPGACLVCHSTDYDPATGTSSAEGVNCGSCHNPIPANHPKDTMPITTSPDLCGKCHSDSRFSTDNWKLSTHYQRGMDCTVCHDPHTAGMKTVTGTTFVANKDASALCENCHKDAMQNFPTSKHAEAGVTCVNCHLGFNVGDQNVDFGKVHAAPDHSFLPSLETCNKCHADQMHAPGQAVAAAAIKIEAGGGTPTPAPSPVVSPVPPVSSEPAPISPIGFATMASVVGLAFGMVLAPWLERAYSHLSKGDKND
jgi:predicted CXXCH cytochrome family protein